MPFMMARVSTHIAPQQERVLKERLGRAISLVPGKSEQVLLLGIEGDCHLYLRGKSDEPIAYVEVSIFDNASHAGYTSLTREILETFVEVLDLAPDHVYVHYHDIRSWGIAGMYIDG